MRAFLILPLAFLTACSHPSIEPEPQLTMPVPPSLTAALAASCPPLSLLNDTTIGTLANEDLNAAYSYAECQLSKDKVTELYRRVREAMIFFASESGLPTKEIQP